MANEPKCDQCGCKMKLVQKKKTKNKWPISKKEGAKVYKCTNETCAHVMAIFPGEPEHYENKSREINEEMKARDRQTREQIQNGEI